MLAASTMKSRERIYSAISYECGHEPYHYLVMKDVKLISENKNICIIWTLTLDKKNRK